MDIELQFSPSSSEVAFGIEKWANLLDSFEDVFRRVVALFRAHERKHFDTEGTYTGPKFAELSAAYSAWKEDNFPGRPILVQTGALRDALAFGGPGSIEDIGPRRLRVGVDEGAIPYAAAHAFGLGHMPERPLIRFDGSFTGTPRAGTFGFAVTQLFQAYVVWARRRALGTDDPFHDERFSGRVDAIMQYATGDEGELDNALAAALQGMTGA